MIPRMPELQAIAHYTVAAGNEDAVAALLPLLVQASRAEPGNLSYGVYRSLENPRDVVILERYVSREAFADHRASPHFAEIGLGQIIPLLDGRVVEVFDVAAG